MNIKWSRLFVQSATLVLCCAAVSSCTKSIGVSSVSTGTEAISGAPYVLLFDQFPVKVNYELVACGKEPQLKVTASSGDVVGAVDPKQIYAIDLDSLAGPFRTHDISLEFNPDLGVKTLNAKAEDRTAETIGKVIETAAGIAKIAIAAAGVEAPPAELCKKDTLQALASIKAKKKVVEDALRENKARQARFDVLKAKIDAQGGVATEALGKDFANAYRLLQASTDALASAKTAYDNARAAVTHVHEVSWPGDGKSTTEIIDFGDTIASKTFDKWLIAPSRELDDNGQYDVKLSLSQVSANALTVSGSDTVNDETLAKGVPFRVAMPARLEISLPFGRDEDGNVMPTVLLKKEAPLRQFGRIMLLPCVSRPFTSISCSLAFDDKGRLSKIGNANTKAQGEAVAGLLAGGVTQAQGVATAIQTANEKREGKEKADKQAQLDILELDQKISDAIAKRDASPTQVDAWNKEILENQTERQLLESRRLLDEERAKAEG